MMYILQAEEEPLDTSYLMLIICFALAFVTPWLAYCYKEFFTESGRQLRAKQLAEKKARKESKSYAKKAKAFSGDW